MALISVHARARQSIVINFSGRDAERKNNHRGHTARRHTGVHRYRRSVFPRIPLPADLPTSEGVADEWKEGTRGGPSIIRNKT